jgi:lincosamide nucleotidyltransferase A/C/D/E
MTADDVLQIVYCLESSSIEMWFDGGWGVDALVGEQTRPHKDLDIVVRETDVPRLRGVLESEGFREVGGGTLWNFILVDERGREVDVHTVRFDGDGNALYGPNGLMYPARSLDGIGTVRGIRVRCKTAEAQMADRAGFEWRAGDYHDVRLLHERLGIPLPRHYDLRMHEWSCMDETPNSPQEPGSGTLRR